MKYRNLINGEWKESDKEIKIYSPINDEELGSIPSMTREEVDYAMETAKIALSGWRNLAVVERAKYLYKAAEILERDKEIIGTVLAKEVSKGIKAAISEVVRTADLIRYSAEEGLRSVGEIVEGGSFTLQQFIDAGIWDEAFVIKADNLNLTNGTKAPVFSPKPNKISKLRDNTLYHFQNQ